MSRSILLTAVVAAAVAWFTPSTARADDPRFEEIVRVLEKYDQRLRNLERLQNRDDSQSLQPIEAATNIICLVNYTDAPVTVVINNKAFGVAAFGTVTLAASAGRYTYSLSGGSRSYRSYLKEYDELTINIE